MCLAAAYGTLICELLAFAFVACSLLLLSWISNVVGFMDVSLPFTPFFFLVHFDGDMEESLLQLTAHGYLPLVIKIICIII